MRKIDDPSARVPCTRIMRSHHDDHALPGEIAQHFADRVSGSRVQLGGRLIHQQHVGVRAHRTRKHEPLRFASGQFGESTVHRIVQIEQSHDLLGFRDRFASAHAMAEQRKDHMVERGSFGHAVRVLEHPSDAVDAFTFHLPGPRFDPSRKNGQQRGFAASRWTTKRDGLSGGDGEVKVFEKHIRSRGTMRQPDCLQEHVAPAIFEPTATEVMEAASPEPSCTRLTPSDEPTMLTVCDVPSGVMMQPLLPLMP